MHQVGKKGYYYLQDSCCPSRHSQVQQDIIGKVLLDCLTLEDGTDRLSRNVGK